MKWLLRYCLTYNWAFLLVLAGMQQAALAGENNDTILLLPEQHTILSISATEQREVQEDLLVASLEIRSTHADSRDVQNDINAAMQKALARAAELPTIETNTGSYQVYEIHEPRTKEKKWQGRQALVLKSRESQLLLDVVAKLQAQGFTVTGLNYTLAPQTVRSMQDEMLESALSQLRERATRAAKALGKSKAELKEVTVQDANNINAVAGPAVFRMQAERSGADVATPAAQAGKATVSLTVTARALLAP
jgi:predicted secreted protein